MNELLHSFERFIKKEKLFSSSDKLLVAVSGGIDSIALVHLLHTTGFTFAMAHCNFQLRGKDADEDEAFVKQLGSRLNLQTYTKSFDTKTYAKENNLSTQVAARDLRYAWFDELITKENCNYLLTAHHANDQVETILYNLTKGTGIAGMRGIPVCNDKIRRPLLFASREEIEIYSKQYQLSWREDLSNKEDKYSRNHIRLNVIPELKKINPGLEQTMLTNQQRFSSLEHLLLDQTDKIKTKYLTKNSGDISIAMDWLETSKGGLVVLNELIKPYGFNWDQTVSIAEAIKQNASGKQFQALNYSLYVDRTSLEITPNKDTNNFHKEISAWTESLETPFCKMTFRVVKNNGTWSNDPRIAYLNADKIEFPLTIRTWNQGDSFQPLGMKGKKKLSDFMIDEKIPVNLKSRVLVLESNEEIIWVAGHRIDDRYKITSDSSKVLIVKMSNHV